jgi:hypothetical protein
VTDHAAIRVSIKRSARDPNLFVVRKLEEGKTVPMGSKEAFLLLPDRDADPFGS